MVMERLDVMKIRKALDEMSKMLNHEGTKSDSSPMLKEALENYRQALFFLSAPLKK